MANAYNIRVTIAPIEITEGNQARAVAAAKFAKWAHRALSRTLAWFVNGETSGEDVEAVMPAVKVEAVILDGPNKGKIKEIPVYGVAASTKKHTFKVKEEKASPTFDLDAFLNKSE